MEVVVSEEIREEGFIGGAGRRVGAVAVERLVVQPGDERVDHHVGRTGVKGVHPIPVSPARENRHVRDPAEVEEGALLLIVREQHPVEVGHERRALPAERDVAVRKSPMVGMPSRAATTAGSPS